MNRDYSDYTIPVEWHNHRKNEEKTVSWYADDLFYFYFIRREQIDVKACPEHDEDIGIFEVTFYHYGMAYRKNFAGSAAALKYPAILQTRKAIET